MRKLTLLCNALVELASAGTAFSQGLSTINGAVADASGAMVAGAKITVTEVDTGLPRETVSNSEGLYVLSSLRPTRYALIVEVPGFRRFSASGITLQANDTTTMNVKLELGALSEVVEVRAAAVQVDTTTSTLKQVVDSARIIELHLQRIRSFKLAEDKRILGKFTVPLLP
jgi:hypothetical protein